MGLGSFGLSQFGGTGPSGGHCFDRTGKGTVCSRGRWKGEGASGKGEEHSSRGKKHERLTTGSASSYTPPPNNPAFKLWTHKTTHALVRPLEPTNRMWIMSKAHDQANSDSEVRSRNITFAGRKRGGSHVRGKFIRNSQRDTVHHRPWKSTRQDGEGEGGPPRVW
jgi:hypothetical protein